METHQQLLKILDALNRVSRGLRRSQDSPDSDLSAIKALDELRAASGLILSGDPLLVSLSQHLSQLADSVQDLHNTKPAQGLISFLTRRVRSHEVSRLAAEIESELDALIDRENLSNLTKNLAGMRCNVQASVASSEEDQLFDLMSVLQERLSRGFDIDLQDLLLKSGIFTELEWVSLQSPVLQKGPRKSRNFDERASPLQQRRVRRISSGRRKREGINLNGLLVFLASPLIANKGHQEPFGGRNGVLRRHLEDRRPLIIGRYGNESDGRGMRDGNRVFREERSGGIDDQWRADKEAGRTAEGGSGGGEREEASICELRGEVCSAVGGGRRAATEREKGFQAADIEQSERGLRFRC
ncbi:UNVERIFIED_CONTAM: hypothetical protein Scaly_2032600 [Sesamum calycinum]|uniref:Uncharacterized protein n=1 Tax=Sesamum calycinum TaxID=2727403 RepID=A0AAW2N1G8_9LAMI